MRIIKAIFMLLAMTGGQIESSSGKVTLKKYRDNIFCQKRHIPNLFNICTSHKLNKLAFYINK